jgi:alpha-mannosidase
MTIRRASVILPSRGFDDFPTHLAGPGAADLLSGATALWHPALIQATQALPGWHPAEEMPDPGELEGELVVIPSSSRERMAPDWADRLRATAPRNPAPVDAVPSRPDTVAALLNAAAVDSGQVTAESVANFLALGYAHMQVELITHALRYSSVLDSDQFASAVIAAAGAALAGNVDTERDELARAFDLLSDARNHVYSVDFYVIDVTLLADSTLGTSLENKLATDSRTNLLITGEQIERIAGEYPATLTQLKRSLEAGTASIVGGTYRGGAAGSQSPESFLADLIEGQRAARQHLDRDYEVYGQFETEFSPLIPIALKNLGFRGALHAGFDGGPLPKADQRKTNWGPDGTKIEALATLPLDASRPETWLKLAGQIGDTIAHDHVATILLAAWPGTECEYFDDLRRVARFGPVLGKLVTLDEYFRETREADDWTNFHPREYPSRPGSDYGTNPITSRVDAYRRSVSHVHHQIAGGLASIAGFATVKAVESSAPELIAINPWNVVSNEIVGSNALEAVSTPQVSKPFCLPEVPGCGFASFSTAAGSPAKPIAEGLTLRTERFELTVSKKTGGIQSLRTLRDRNTRVSQRLVFHHHLGEEPTQTQMVADRIEVSRNDAVVGEITSRGRVLGAAGDVLTKFTQRVRAVRGVPAVIVDVELEPQHLPAGNIWKCYFASRLAWSVESLSIRRGKNWSGLETTRECIDSSEWVEVDDGLGHIVCFALGLPFHRIAGPQWLDTLLLVAGEERRRFQFAIGIDQTYQTHAAVALLSACDPYISASSSPLGSPRGWLLHVGAKNVLCTHIGPLTAPANGIRMRLLETEGRDTQTTLAAFRPFQAAWMSDFRGNRADVLSLAEGRAQIDIGPNGWVQIEAEW